MATAAQLLEDSLLVIWNDRNTDRRLATMQRVYAADIQFFESNASEAIVGHQPLNALIDKLQAGWPTNFLFALSRPAQVNHQVQHAAWTLGSPGEPPVATGVDVAIVENDLITSLYLLLDAAEVTEATSAG